ncbi:MAG: hypothetical protein WD490_08255 [Opitutales bacterium]
MNHYYLPLYIFIFATVSLITPRAFGEDVATLRERVVQQEARIQDLEARLSSLENLPEIRVASQVRRNFRLLEAAMEQYCLINRVSECELGDLVGPGRFLDYQRFRSIDGESYRDLRLAIDEPKWKVHTSSGLIITYGRQEFNRENWERLWEQMAKEAPQDVPEQDESGNGEQIGADECSKGHEADPIVGAWVFPDDTVINPYPDEVSDPYFYFFPDESFEYSPTYSYPPGKAPLIMGRWYPSELGDGQYTMEYLRDDGETVYATFWCGLEKKGFHEPRLTVALGDFIVTMIRGPDSVRQLTSVTRIEQDEGGNGEQIGVEEQSQ